MHKHIPLELYTDIYKIYYQTVYYFIKHFNIKKLLIILLTGSVFIVSINLPAEAAGEVHLTDYEEIRLEQNLEQNTSDFNSNNFISADFNIKLNVEDKIAIASPSITGQLPFSPLMAKPEDSGLWIRPYLNIEKVSLTDGTIVNNTSYGNLLGYDFKLKEFGDRFEYVYSLYGGYSGAKLSYDDVSINQNGGFLGALGIIYKGNFFTSLTSAFKAVGVRSNSSSDFIMISPDVSSRTGYNIKMFNDKVILQPNYIMTYSFIATQSYTDKFTGEVPSSRLHLIQIAPSIKLVCNLKNGWEPYLSVTEIWTMINSAKSILPADASIPQLAVTPFAEYGAGVQKKHEKDFVGFFQVMARSGGRSGVAFLAGLWWHI